MNTKKRNYFIAFIFLNLILIYWIVIYNEYHFDKILKYAKELAVFEFSTISLIIAISLFDQFGLNKKLTEKRVELIIELLTELKKQDGFGSHYFQNGQFITNPSFYFERDMALKNSQKEFIQDIMETPIVMNLTDFDNGFQKVREVLNNPIMPKSILEKAKFIAMNGGSGNSNLIKSPEILYLYFTTEGKKMLIAKDIRHWLFAANNNCTLYSFLQKFDALFQACEDWTNKHSNIDEELNLKNF